MKTAREMKWYAVGPRVFERVYYSVEALIADCGSSEFAIQHAKICAAAPDMKKLIEEAIANGGAVNIDQARAVLEKT